MQRDYIYVSIILVLLLFMFILLILMQEEKKDTIKLSECSKPKGDYAVIAGYETTETVKKCGADGSSICKFSVSNLKSALGICNSHHDKCSKFMYNKNRNTITFIEDTNDLTINSGIDIFTKQT